jgi:parvulin-like peptidyl-prolyl isomerase
VKSGYGVHLVRLTDLRPAILRPFQEVRPKVLEEWRRQREDQTKAQYLGKLREKYGVVIDDSVTQLLPAPPPEAKTQ